MPDTDTIAPDDIARRFGFTPDGRRIGASAAPARPSTAAVPEPADGSDIARRFGFDASGQPLSPAAKPAPSPMGKKDDIEARAQRLAENAGVSSSVVEGMPIVGPLAQRAAAAGRAAIDAARDQSRSFGEHYDRELETLRRANEIYHEQHPLAATAGNVGGAGVLTVPVAQTGIGARLLGLRGDIPSLGIGNTLGSRFYSALLGGGAVGATDAALRGQDPAVGGTLGGVTGAAPIVGQAAGSIVRGAVNTARDVPGLLAGVNPIAREWLAGAMANETPASIAAGRARMGPHGFVSDINPSMTELAAGMASKAEPPASAEIGEAYRMRQAQARQVTEDALNSTIGPPRNIEHFRDAIVDARTRVSDPLYRQFRSTPVEPTPELRQMIPALEQLGLTREAEEHALMRGVPFANPAAPPTAASGYPTTESWDMIKRAIDARIERAHAGGANTRAADLVTLKNRIIGEVGRTPAGPIWNQARQAFAEQSSLLDQMAAGRDTFLGGRAGGTPDQLREELRGLTQPELQARLVGVRQAAADIMDATRNGDATMRLKLLAPNNQEKLRLMLRAAYGRSGNARADHLIQTIEQQSYLAGQAQYVNPRAGSATAPRTQAAKALDAPPLDPYLANLNVLKPGTWLPQSWIHEFLPATILQGGREAGYAAARQQLSPVLRSRNIGDFVSALAAENAGRGRAIAAGDAWRQAITAALAGPGSEEFRKRGRLPNTRGVLSAPAH